MNNRVLLFSLASVFVISGMVGCTEPAGMPMQAPPVFTAQDTLGNYDVALASTIKLRGTYLNATTNENSVPSVLFTGKDSFTALSISRNEAGGEFVVLLEQDGKQDTLHVPDSAVTAVVKADSMTGSTTTGTTTVPFSPDLQEPVSVTLSVQLGNALVDSVSNGCQTTTTDSFGVTFTKEGLTGSFHSKTSYATVGTFSSDPYQSCQDVLGEIETRIRTNSPELSDLPIYVANGAINIDSLRSLSAVEYWMGFSGQKSAAMTAAMKQTKSSIIPNNGQIARFEFQTKALRTR